MQSKRARYERHDEDSGEDNTFHGERFQGSCTLKRLELLIFFQQEFANMEIFVKFIFFGWTDFNDMKNKD